MGRPIVKGGGIAIAILACTAAIAWAAPANVTTGALNTFSAASFDHDAGTVATLTNLAGGDHNVTSDALLNGLPLFSSATISSGSTPIDGTQFIAAGDYGFYCSVHGSPSGGMRGTLHVIGTPLPRPPAAGSTGTGVVAKKKCKKGRKLKRGRCVKKRKHRRR